MVCADCSRLGILRESRLAAWLASAAGRRPAWPGSRSGDYTEINNTSRRNQYTTAILDLRRAAQLLE